MSIDAVIKSAARRNENVGVAPSSGRISECNYL
jgi:hypothetical protein